jgi:hypothetical protein
LLVLDNALCPVLSEDALYLLWRDSDMIQISKVD